MKGIKFFWILFVLFLTNQQLIAQIDSIHNPVLPGFNPDPCIVNVNDDYYIVTSSFEWFPGIPIYHSKDLINWNQIGHVLTRKSQLDMRGIGDSDGIFAPSITYHKGLYYVIFTTVQDGVNWSLKGYPNYIVTARDPKGPWSEPVLVNSLGFDPFLFIDDNEEAYVLFRTFDHRPGKPASAGIGMHSIDLKTFQPIGEPKLIYTGWNRNSAEGPKLLKKDGYYYLFTAEGGTSYEHYEAVARSKSIWGEYERSPQIFYTTRGDSSSSIQKAGHGTVFSTPNGEWYTTHLGSRPLSSLGACPLGRETFIQKVRWNAGAWPVLDNTTGFPEEAVVAPVKATGNKREKELYTFFDSFDSKKIDVSFQTLREPWDKSWLNLERKKGTLALKGRRALGSRFDQSLVVRRLTSLTQTYETALEFDPKDFRHLAGLACYYDTKHFFSLGLTVDDHGDRQLVLTGVDKTYKQLAFKGLEGSEAKVRLKVSFSNKHFQFYFSTKEGEWDKIGPEIQSSILSDDYTDGFTGAMVGLFSQDMLYEREWAYFDYLKVY
ncbi:glycoside hydrolase family 43 protein [Sphingobacterium puteale]|uniref:Glycoside hydrolase family 43 protein n=1 Tax=Sphingobacterium puteale TaxID=2420510 RepID=A0A420VUV3_9SPHI|nr:family 43 glycosylhydrolase [Sphingobacterium puteale]RKO70126.1 glycoside hydrolase family 43 protein [Sphingobacterium puteale]